MQLRPYQQQAVDALRNSFRANNKRVILCAPTGAGKTVIFSYMVSEAIRKGKRVLIVTDRIELLTQSGGALNRYDINPIEITANSKPDLSANCFVGMVETIARRLGKTEYSQWIAGLDLVIFDEAHKQAFNKLFQSISPATFVIGATATPHREGTQSCLSEFYTDLIEVIDIPTLIEQGYLARPRSFHVPIDLSKVAVKGGDYDLSAQGQFFSEQKLYKGAVSNYARLCPHSKTLAFAPTIAASKELCNEFAAHGYNAKHLDSEMSAKEREAVLAWYAENKDAVLCNCGILTTGFDAPETETVLLYRATKSLPLFLQMVGRGARVTKNKQTFTVLDFGSNIKTHGLWEEKRPWSLKKKKRKEGGVAPVKECPNCEALVHTSARECPECNHVFKQKKKTVEEVELEEVGRVRDMCQNMEKKHVLKLPFDDLVRAIKAGIIKPSYAIYNRCVTVADALRLTRALEYKDGWLWHQQKNGNFKHLIK